MLCRPTGTLPASSPGTGKPPRCGATRTGAVRGLTADPDRAGGRPWPPPRRLRRYAARSGPFLPLPRRRAWRRGSPSR